MQSTDEFGIPFEFIGRYQQWINQWISRLIRENGCMPDGAQRRVCFDASLLKSLITKDLLIFQYVIGIYDWLRDNPGCDGRGSSDISHVKIQGDTGDHISILVPDKFKI